MVTRSRPPEQPGVFGQPGQGLVAYAQALTAGWSAMLKYLGSKRRLVPALAAAATATNAATTADLFTGTTRVAQAFKQAGMHVIAADSASYSQILADCFIATDADKVDTAALTEEIDRLNQLPGESGYVTEVFCHKSQFFQPQNGERIDAIRNAIEEHRGTWLFPLLLTSLLQAADRVDSTTGLQMAYLKQWAPRSYRTLELQVPNLIPGSGSSLPGDVTSTVQSLGPIDLAYLDPPYNQHRYDSNYHIWETLVRWDSPQHYGRACKRIDLRDSASRSPFNSKKTFAPALSQLLENLDASVVMLSYNDESWVSAQELDALLRENGLNEIQAVGFESNRYVGSRIGIHNPKGKKVGTVGRTRNIEWLFIAGDKEMVESATIATQAFGGQPLEIAK